MKSHLIAATLALVLCSCGAHSTHTVPAELGKDGSLALSGEMKLPGGLGTYQVKGRLTRETFTATYQGANDKGTMSLKRPAP